MTRKEVLQGLTMFSSAYRNAFKDIGKDESKLMLDLWERKFSRYGSEEYLAVVDYMIDTKIFMPSIAEIVEELEKRRAPELATAPIDAWAHVREVVRRFGYYQWQQASEALSERERAIVKSLGWTKICLAENGYEQEQLKKEFIELYEGSRQRALVENLGKTQLEYQTTKMLENKSV